LELRYSTIDEPKGTDARWDDFRAFVAIADSTSIKRAATKLGTTQSALSKRLSRLEKSLNVRLIDRGPTGASLTYQGERVYFRVMTAQKELSRAASDAQSAEGRVEGDCSLLMGDGIANYWLSKFLPPFFDRYPNVELKLMLDHDIGAARNQIFDIRLHYFEPIDPAQIMKPIATVHFVPFASRDYLAKHGTPRNVSDLSSHRVLDQTQHLVGKGAWSAWFGNEILSRTALFTNQSAFLAKCVHEGVGIALMPTYMSLMDETIVPLDLNVTFPAKLFASYHRERAAKTPVKTTLDYLRTIVFNIKAMPWFTEEFQLPADGWRPEFRAAMDLASPLERGAGSSSSMHELPLQAASAAR
jgi:DNA-binding transcriptional LysR family regulator